MNPSESFVQRLINGDQSAFAGMVAIHQDMVYNTALSIVQQSEEADDITQEVFIQVHLSASSFKGEAKFSTWLYQLTVSKTLDHLRKKKRKKRFGLVQSLFGSHSEVVMQPSSFNHPGVELEKKESAQQLFRALKLLPEKQMIAFSLNKIEGLPIQEVAVIMNMNLTAVESLVARAKQNLKKQLETFYTENLRNQ